MAGYRGLRVSSPMASRVDYKGGGDLKSCFSEFSLNLLVAPPSVGHSPILTEYHVSDLLLLSSLSRFIRDALRRGTSTARILLRQQTTASVSCTLFANNHRPLVLFARA